MQIGTYRRRYLFSAAALVASMSLMVPTAAYAHGPSTHTRHARHGGGHGGHAHGRWTHLAPRTHFRMDPDGASGRHVSGEGIPNIDSVKSTVRTFYGDNGDNKANLRSSPYSKQMHRIVNRQLRTLKSRYRAAARHHQKPALVFDADDTTLSTYDMEAGAMHFHYDPKINNEYTQDGRFDATPAMVRLVNRAHHMGYTIFGITGRNDDQKAASLSNLKKVGYHGFSAKRFYTKWTGKKNSQQPNYIHCAKKDCTTVEFKAQTRKHIEKKGYRIVENWGDQWSDLKGRHADHAVKLPNPRYYLPSPNLPGVHQPRMAPRRTFQMMPDGSSGRRPDGDGIPNLDSAKSTVRTYYGAHDGQADRHNSPYIRQMRSIVHQKSPRLLQQCRRGSRFGQNPAVVLDADDTTLWGYDMEDGAMHFHFDPKIQNNDWVQPEKFPAVPGMVHLVNRAHAAGCTIIGLTGRSDDQKDATVANLDKVGYRGFSRSNFYTKWSDDGDSSQPGYIHCAAKKCSTVEFKSQTRRHIESRAGGGYTIVANVGDQYSDLKGGHARHMIKLPNPMYYLP